MRTLSGLSGRVGGMTLAFSLRLFRCAKYGSLAGYRRCRYALFAQLCARPAVCAHTPGAAVMAHTAIHRIRRIPTEPW